MKEIAKEILLAFWVSISVVVLMIEAVRGLPDATVVAIIKIFTT